jgi:two-component system OmpR family sensor kinase
MTGQLEALIGAQRRLLHDISHELRSPLARLQAAIGLVRQNPQQLDATLDRLEREVTRLDELVDEVLTLARLDSGLPGVSSQSFDLLALLDEVIGDAQFEAESLHKCVRYRGGGEAHMHGRADLLMRAVENIVRNAIRYTPESQCVEVESQCQGGQVRISVSDHGPGVADSELDAIFQPFYRSPSNPTGTGYGLGLAIARRAVESHGGQIVARNRPEGGLRVEITLPLTPVAEPH